MSDFDHMNSKVNTHNQKIDNLTIILATIVVVVTPNCEIYEVQGHITTDYRLLSEPTHD